MSQVARHPSSRNLHQPSLQLSLLCYRQHLQEKSTEEICEPRPQQRTLLRILGRWCGVELQAGKLGELGPPTPDDVDKRTTSTSTTDPLILNTFRCRRETTSTTTPDTGLTPISHRTPIAVYRTPN